MNGDIKLEEIVIKYLAGEATEQEARELLEWIALSKENESYYLGFKKIFDASPLRPPETFSIDVDQEWNQFLKSVPPVRQTPVIPLADARSGWMRLAAALVIFVVSGFIITWFVLRKTEVIYTTQSESLAVILPDGSHITLNDHSTLTLSSDFGEKARTVSLAGEAFFDVSHDKQKPFIINAINTRVEVVGTSFDIRSYGNETAVEVAVQTGIVKFSAVDAGNEVSLTAGQKGIFVRKTKALQQSENGDPNFSAWTTKRLVFIDSDLRKVVETLNKTYHSNIVLSADAPPTCSVTVTFDHQTMDAVLHVLETTLNLTLKRTGNKIEITHAGC